MKPLKKLATAQTPDGGELVLYQHDRDFSIQVNGQGLMNRNGGRSCRNGGRSCRKKWGTFVQKVLDD